MIPVSIFYMIEILSEFVAASPQRTFQEQSFARTDGRRVPFSVVRFSFETALLTSDGSIHTTDVPSDHSALDERLVVSIHQASSSSWPRATDRLQGCIKSPLAHREEDGIDLFPRRGSSLLFPSDRLPKEAMVLFSSNQTSS